MRVIQYKRDPRALVLTHILLPAVAIAVIILADIYLITQTAITPLGCTILMTILAMFMRPAHLSLWAVICVAAVFCMLKYNYNADMTHLEQGAYSWTVGVRTLGSAVVAAALVVLSGLR